MLNVKKIAIWSAEVEDRVGSTTGLFKALSDAGADLRFALARRQPDKPGKGILFVSPIQGPQQEAAARQAALARRSDVTGVQVEGVNKPGMGLALTQAVASAGLNLRALSAHVIGKNFSAVFAFDNEADADKGVQALKAVKD